MIKKIYIILFIAILITTCGKKGAPIYNEENQNTKISNTQLSVLS